jgi:hypothetical protein
MHDVDYQVAAVDLVRPPLDRIPLQARHNASNEALESKHHKPLIHNSNLLSFEAMDEVTHKRVDEETSHLLEEIRPSLPIIREFLLSLEEELSEISNSRGIRTIIDEDLLKDHNPKLEMNYKSKKLAADLFYLLAIECKRNLEFNKELEINYGDPTKPSSSELLLLISDTIGEIGREFKLSYLGVDVKKND